MGECTNDMATIPQAPPRTCFYFTLFPEFCHPCTIRGYRIPLAGGKLTVDIGCPIWAGSLQGGGDGVWFSAVICRRLPEMDLVKSVIASGGMELEAWLFCHEHPGDELGLPFGEDAELRHGPRECLGRCLGETAREGDLAIVEG